MESRCKKKVACQKSTKTAADPTLRSRLETTSVRRLFCEKRREKMHSQEREREREQIDTATFSPNHVQKLDLLGLRGRTDGRCMHCSHGWPGGGERGEWCTVLHLFQNSREEIRIPSPLLSFLTLSESENRFESSTPPSPCVTRLRSPWTNKGSLFLRSILSSRVMVERGKNDFKKGQSQP